MANDGQKEKIGDDTPTGSGRPTDLDVEGDNCNEETCDKNHGEEDVGQEGDVPKKSDRSEYYNEDDLQVWKDRCLWRDDEIKGMANKLADLQTAPFPLQDTPIPAARKDTQTGGQKTTPTTPQHDRTKEHSHWPSREVRHGESQKTRSRPR
ncbi:hypothetical protein ACSBR2_009117 [Camellia fascicularis]